MSGKSARWSLSRNCHTCLSADVVWVYGVASILLANVDALRQSVPDDVAHAREIEDRAVEVVAFALELQADKKSVKLFRIKKSVETVSVDSLGENFTTS